MDRLLLLPFTLLLLVIALLTSWCPVSGFSSPLVPSTTTTTTTTNTVRCTNTLLDHSTSLLLLQANAASSDDASSSSSSLVDDPKQEEEDDDNMTTLTDKGLFKRDRYIATNRFSVRKNQQAKFEKRWATRKSKLALLEGFQYFHLMRRVTLIDDQDNDDKDENNEPTTTTTMKTTYLGGDSKDEAFENYISFTIWNKKSHFSAWRSGEAFKEAHGGTSIAAFVSTMLNSARVLRGAPRPAFYDSLFLQKQTIPTFIPETIDGWRCNVKADGIHTLQPECFVSMQKFFIPTAAAATEFEQFWSNNNKKMMMNSKSQDDNDDDNIPGFVLRSVMRRDGQAKGHGIVQMESSEPTYVTVTIFQDLSSYQAWMKKENKNSNTTTTHLPASFSNIKPPETVYYEGTLVISSPQGA